MKFTDLPYKRPDIEKHKTQFEELLDAFEGASSVETQIEVIDRINEIRSEFDTFATLAAVRHTIDTADDFYEAEKQYFDERYPELGELSTRYYALLSGSAYREQLEKIFGHQLFDIATLKIKSFDPSIIDELKKINLLNTSYKKIQAQASIEVNGEKYNLSSIAPLEESPDRDTRKKAATAKWDFYKSVHNEVESIFDQMVKLRHETALKLGFENYIELGYANMLRTDYDAEKLVGFRKQIQEHIVPIASELYKRQQKRIGIDHLYYYDEPFKFMSGNPKPVGSPNDLVHKASIMYKELSAETHEFFQFMTQNEMMDLVAKDGKQTGGYCTFLNKFKSPFIFSNFNGTAHDITVLTHEAGHAFQCYTTSKTNKISEYLWPTFEACEIHSMSMEFLTWPWMEMFFEKDTDKFKFSHLAGAIQFLPYGVAVDEFQHKVYQSPDMSIEERNACWADIESKYLPHRDYGDNDFLKQGRLWQRQTHIFSVPFYYIDYVLAQICAFQLWMKYQENSQKTWSDYLNLCKFGGRYSFTHLIELSNLNSPFEISTIQQLKQPLQAILERIDDSAF